jgi:transposase
LNALAVEAPEWLQAQIPAEWYGRYAARFEAYRLPKTEPARQEWAETIGRDGEELLARVYTAQTPPAVRLHPAVEVLRQVWVQQYVTQEGALRWRTAENLPPAERLLLSPYDPEARYSRKRDTQWTGYKVHLTESCDLDAPRLLTQVLTSAATTPDGAVTETIHDALAAKALLPRQHIVDAGYVDAAVVVNSQQQYGIEVVGPVAPDTSWQAQAGQGFALAHFTIDWPQHRVLCPQGHASHVWAESHDTFGNPVTHVRFAPAACHACAVRALCTHSTRGARTLKLHPQAQHEALQQARQYQTTPEFKAQYAIRAGVEGSLSQGTRSYSLRRTRYLGQAKTHLQHLLSAVALNLARFVAWVQETPLASTRTSAFAALAQQT